MLSSALGNTGGILYFVLRLRGVAEPPLHGPALQTQVLRCLCFSLFFQALVVTCLCFVLSHTSLASKQTHNTTRACAQPPPEHKNIMLMRQAQLFPSSPFLFQQQSPNFSRSFKEPPSRRTVNANISLREIRNIFYKSELPLPAKMWCVTRYSV